MENAMTVASILKEKGTDVITIHRNASLREAVVLLAEKGIGALLVCGDGEAIAGMLSERDIVRGLAGEGADLLDRPVSDLMTEDVVTASPHDSVVQVMGIMTNRRFRHLPIVNKGRLEGMVSIGDVVKRRIAEAEQEAEALKSYIQSG